MRTAYMVPRSLLTDHKRMESWLAARGSMFYNLIAEDIKGMALIEVVDDIQDS